MNKTPKIIYIFVAIFCILAVIVGVYEQFVQNNINNTVFTGVGEENEEEDTDKTQEELYADVTKLFTNEFIDNEYDKTGIIKKDNQNDIIYTIYNLKEATDSYEIDIKVPYINIESAKINELNNITQDIFLAKANEVLKKTDTEIMTMYNIDYIAYINSDILSMAIKSTIKEGQNSQRVIIQTYNYNLKTEELVNLNDIITLKKLNKEEVNSKIIDIIKQADEQSKIIEAMGYPSAYTRDLTDKIYTVDYASTYLLGQDNNLYIIYPYGNQNYTSDMDIVNIK